MKTYKKPFTRVIQLGTRRTFLVSQSNEVGEDEFSKGVSTGGGSSMWENMDED